MVMNYKKEFGGTNYSDGLEKMEILTVWLKKVITIDANFV
jgi:hypothetical protein